MATAIVRCCWAAKAHKLLNAHLLALCKRRGQLKQAILDVVQLAMTYIPLLEARADKQELIVTLKTVTDGKIYAEVERARVTLALAALQEAEGRVAEASETLQECAVETFGSMDRKEKTDMLLEQVRRGQQQQQPGPAPRPFPRAPPASRPPHPYPSSP